MGNLKPGVPLIYESPDGGNTIYGREPGQDPRERKLIGYKYPDPRTSDGRPLHEHIIEDKMWGEIRLMAKTNSTLQKALDRAIMIYKLSKDEQTYRPF